MGAAVPRMHGLAHVRGGPDPIKGVGEVDTDDVGVAATISSFPDDLVVYSVPGVQTVANGTMRKYLEQAGLIIRVRAAVGVAPVGSGLTVRMNVNGVSRATVTIPAGTNTATVVPASTALAAGDYVTFDVTAVGSGPAGSELVVTVWGRYP